MTEHRLLSSLLRPLVKPREVSFSLPGTISDGARILAIDDGDLSNMLFFVPLLSGLRNRYPGASIDFLLPEPHTPLVIPSGLARQCLVYRPHQLKPWRPAFGSLLRGLRNPGYDIAILMSMEPQACLELACLASGAVLRLGPSHAQAYPALNVELRSLADEQLYRGDRVRPLTAFLGLSESDLDPAWPLPEDRLRQSERLVHFNKPDRSELLVGVDPGLGKCGHGIALQNLLFLTRQLSSQVRCRFLPLSDTSNRQRLREFEAQLGNVPPGLVRDTLLETVLLLAQCDLFLAGNTDLFHFAVALDVPTVGIFTPRDDPSWDPGLRPSCRVLRATRGERVDVATLMDAVEAVRRKGGSTPAPLRARAPAADSDAGVSPQADAERAVPSDGDAGPPPRTDARHGSVSSAVGDVQPRHHD